MKAVEELIGVSRRHALPVKQGLEYFCDHLAQRLPFAQNNRLTIADVADQFRQYYRLPVPVAPSIDTLLETLGIALVRHGNPANPDACSAFDTDAQRWEIFVRWDLGRRESLALFQEVFHILNRIGLERVPGWEDWMTDQYRRRSTTTSFAYAVVLPPTQFLQQALCCSLNPWTLARDFLTTPGSCFYALSRHLCLPFPYFQAQLNFRPEYAGQQQLFLAEQGVRAEIWKRSFKRAQGLQTGAWPEMIAAAKAFPRTGHTMEVGGPLYRAIKTGTAQHVLTEEIGGIRLPQPVCLVARPNGTAQSQMFVQIVPADYAELLCAAD